MPRFVTGEETKFEGRSGWSEVIPIPPEARNAKENLCAWLLYAPRAHPMWAFHVLYVLDLNADPFMEKQFEEATHEIGVLALNPEFQPYTVVELQGTLEAPGTTMPYLTPPDVIVQVTASDEQAKLLASYGARASAEGSLVPDSDHARAWEGSLRSTLQHIQAGGHDG